MILEWTSVVTPTYEKYTPDPSGMRDLTITSGRLSRPTEMKAEENLERIVGRR